MSLFLETVPKKPKILKPIGHEMSIFIETVPKKPKKPKIQSYPKSHFSRQLQWLGIFGFFVFFGTVSKNMLISCRSTVSRNMLISLYANMCVHSCRSSYKLHQAS